MTQASGSGGDKGRIKDACCRFACNGFVRCEGEQGLTRLALYALCGFQRHVSPDEHTEYGEGELAEFTCAFVRSISS